MRPRSRPLVQTSMRSATPEARAAARIETRSGCNRGSPPSAPQASAWSMAASRPRSRSTTEAVVRGEPTGRHSGTKWLQDVHDQLAGKLCSRSPNARYGSSKLRWCRRLRFRLGHVEVVARRAAPRRQRFVVRDQCLALGSALDDQRVVDDRAGRENARPVGRTAVDTVTTTSLRAHRQSRLRIGPEPFAG